MLQYILECIAFQLLFLIIYDLFLKRETFFQWNRFYLIGTYIISMILPWIKIEAMKTTVPESFQVYPEFLWNLNDTEVTAIAVEETSFNISWEYALLFGGMFLATLFFVYKLYQIYTLKQKGDVHYFKDFTRIIISNSSIAFSFFKSIFLGDKVMEKEHESIVQHELVHIHQRHSYDLMFFELMRIVGWFNPLVYVYQSRVSELHEFIADAQVAKTSKKEHYEFLLSQVFQTQNISFINQFFKTSLIKKRIVMLKKSKSKKIWQLKYLLLIPMVFGMLAYTSSNSQIDNAVQIVQTKNDIELISEIKKEIEGEVANMGTINDVFFAFSSTRNIKKDTYILTKAEFFKEQLLVKMFFEAMKPIEFGDDVQPRKTLPEMPLPSTSRYESYVSRKEAFYILDLNLQFSIREYDQQVGLIDTKRKYPNSSFIFKVNNVKDLSGDEVLAFNRTLANIFDVGSNYEDLILTDGLFAFRIYEGVVRIGLAPYENIDSKGLITKSKSQTKFNLYDSEHMSSEEKIRQEKSFEEIRNSRKADTSDATDGKSFSRITPSESGINLKAGRLYTDPIPFATVDEVPVFPGCEDVEDKRRCFLESMNLHISKNFRYPKEAQDKGIQGRVNTIFIISKKGKIEGLHMRGPDSLLEREVERIIKKLPKMKPGKHQGKRVDVPFSIPVAFKLNHNGEDLFKKYLDNKKQLNLAEGNLFEQYDQLVEERRRLLKSSNEKNPIIVNLDQQINQLRHAMSDSLKGDINALERMISGVKNSKASVTSLNQLIAERERLLQNSNEKNPIIVNLDAQIKSLKMDMDQESKTIPFATVDKVPVFPGCEDAENKRKCFNEKMQKHISKNFNYPQEAQEKGIQGRVAVMFAIAADGSIQNIRKRGPDALLENEVERIIKRLPQMKAGRHKGKAVNVPFSIPVTFKLKEDKDKTSIKLNSNDSAEPAPLVIIDGKESSLIELHAMPTSEILSMNVFKDEAATRKYGSKGKNGVIVVITKKKF